MKITVVGTGYVGLATTALFSELNHQVIGLDIDKKKIQKLQKGQIPFFEPGLEELIQKGIKKGKLSFTSFYQKAVPQSQVIFICVGTPSKKTGEIDLKYIKQSCRQVAQALTQPTLIVIKSTVPPGIQYLIKPLIQKNTSHRFDFATCPEFLREGNAVQDTFHPDRIIIGAETKTAAQTLLDLHCPLKAPKHVFDINSAQLVKYSANAFLANKISFANQIANLCDLVNADAQLVMLGLGLDQRIGQAFLRPGLGFGGSCFPKDTAALTFLAQKAGLNLRMVKSALKINQDQAQVVFQKIKKLTGPLQNKTIALFGLSFKPGTDDMRQARSLPLLKKLLSAGAKIKATDPVAIPNAQKILKNKSIQFFSNPYQAAQKTDCLVLVTEWPQFEKLQFNRLKKIVKKPNLVDGRNLYDPQKLKKLGFNYLGIGRR